MPTVTQSIGNFLRARRDAHNGPDLVDRWTADMETQVNVAAGSGEPVAGKKNTYSDGTSEWWNIRVPKRANSEPQFHDYQMTWPLDDHAEGIGCTGWDWRKGASRWVGFDFDSLTGHAAGVGVSDAELGRVREAAQALEFVEVRCSTGGKGLHLYVLTDAIPTVNHTEHAALARAILGMMSSETGFDFASQIDACGGNMWIWHRKMSSTNEGLKLLKPATKTLTLADLPANWRDHIDVVMRRRAKVRVAAVTSDAVDPFEALAGARRIVPLDEKHKAIVDELSRSGYTTIWVPDHHLLQTHTRALAKLMDLHKRDLQLSGFFQTISPGRDPGSPNCFAFPLDNGAWKVYRFSPGVAEAETWNQDKEGWTTCFFNRAPTLDVAAAALEGAKMSGGKGYQFDSIEKAAKVIEALGTRLKIPDRLSQREAILKKDIDGSAVVLVKQLGKEQKPEGWAEKRGGWWEKVLGIKAEPPADPANYTEYDHFIRQLVTPSGQDAGWVLRAADGGWHRFSTEKIKLRLVALGHSDKEAKAIIGGAIGKTWKLVNLPFQPEYPGNRQWNLDAAQFRFQPAADPDLAHPHWDMVLAHCGQDLDSAIRAEPWAQQANVKTGGDYLRAWIACLLREPFQPLPYLFLYGDQNSGKSILHEAIGLLMTKGVASADRALTNANDFNGELANCILAYVEEKDIAIAGAAAYNKIKDWVTSPLLWIRRMRTDAYAQPNTLHFIQTANRRNALPLLPGDTRVTVIFVPSLDDDCEIPKRVLLQRLSDEAPAFMRTLCDMTLPAATGRLRLPVVHTERKDKAEQEFENGQQAENKVARFIEERCHYVAGALVRFSEFYKAFQSWAASGSEDGWSKIRVSRAIPERFPYGQYTANVTMIGNLSWQPYDPGPDAKPFVRSGHRLTLKRD